MAITTYIFSGISCTTGAITKLYTLTPPTELFTNKVFSGDTNDFYTVISEPITNFTPYTGVFVVPNMTTYVCPTFKLTCVGDCSYVNNVGYVTLGNQTWYTKNVDVETYWNGDIIPQVTDNTEWANLTTGAWCYYNNDPAMGVIYGKLYNWYAVKNAKGLSDDNGNRIFIPSSSDWHVLSTFLGGDLISANSLKESGTSHWINSNSGATNASCFTALPGGYRLADGRFSGDVVPNSNIGEIGSWWTFTQGRYRGPSGAFVTGAYNIKMYNDNSQITESLVSLNSGFSLRGLNVS